MQKFSIELNAFHDHFLPMKLHRSTFGYTGLFCILFSILISQLIYSRINKYNWAFLNNKLPFLWYYLATCFYFTYQRGFYLDFLLEIIIIYHVGGTSGVFYNPYLVHPPIHAATCSVLEGWVGCLKMPCEPMAVGGLDPSRRPALAAISSLLRESDWKFFAKKMCFGCRDPGRSLQPNHFLKK